MALQWYGALTRLQIPFGVQCDENFDRPLPDVVRRWRRRVLTRAAFVAARSPSAAGMGVVRRWGARGRVGVAPHAMPEWTVAPHVDAPTFTVGYAGRLVSEKGLDDLLAAVRQLAAPVELIVVGDGPRRGTLEHQQIPGSRVRVLDGFSHESMAQAYAQMDVLVLPSRTTPTWKEQFGRVLVEASWCGVPVVGSDSGEIPWVIGETGGGLIFPEGDVAALRECLDRLRADPQLRRELASSGRDSVAARFAVPAATDRLEQLLLGAR